MPGEISRNYPEPTLSHLEQNNGGARAEPLFRIIRASVQENPEHVPLTPTEELYVGGKANPDILCYRIVAGR